MSKFAGVDYYNIDSLLSEEELLVKEIIIRGVLLLQSGVSPSIMEANLKAYLEPAKRALIRSQ